MQFYQIPFDNIWLLCLLLMSSEFCQYFREWLSSISTNYHKHDTSFFNFSNLYSLIACPKPANCNLPVCTDGTDTICEYCVGEHAREKLGFNVYTGLPNKTICQSE